MDSTKNSKSNIYKFILLYSFIFILIRFFASKYGMTYDEAEQFIDAKNFVLGYTDQPPLYSWILKCTSFLFGLNTTMMMMVYHTIVVIFLVFLYKISELIFNDNIKSFYCFISYTLFFIYSYDFYRYTIHTALMMLLCALALYIYLKIYLNKTSLTNYSLLGIFFGLGLLSKYNFIFFILALIFSSCFTQQGRKVLFNLKTLLAIILCLLITAPHLVWVINNDFQPIHYALKRGEAGSTSVIFNLISVLLNTYWNYVVYFLTITIFFFKDFKKQMTEFNKFSVAILIFCIIFPFLLIVILKAANFSQRWLAPLNIFIPIVVFSFIDIRSEKILHKLFKLTVLVLIIVFYTMRISSYYFPSEKRPSFLAKPYKAIFSDFKNDLFKNGININDPDLEIYSFKEVCILAGIQTFNKDLEIKVIYPKVETKKLSNDLIVYSKENNRDFEQFIAENKLEYKNLFSKTAPYLHSKKNNLYKVNFAIINSVE